MRRNRFLEIHQYLYTCDNTQLAGNDKFAKLSNYFKMFSESFVTNFEFVSTQQVSIDETMVPINYGLHELHQDIVSNSFLIKG